MNTSVKPYQHFHCLKWHHFFGYYITLSHWHCLCVQYRGLTSEEFGRDSGTQLLLFGSANIDRVVFPGDKATEGHLSHLEIVLQAAKIYRFLQYKQINTSSEESTAGCKNIHVDFQFIFTKNYYEDFQYMFGLPWKGDWISTILNQWL